MLLVSIGQAGNQLGLELWGLADKNLTTKSCKAGWFRREGEKYVARAVAVDSEPHVLDKMQLSGLFSRGSVLCGQGGGGCSNSWAMGYTVGSSSLLEVTLEAVRREAERSHRLGGICLTHSLGGGTGSGFGSAAVLSLRDAYPSVHIAGMCMGAFAAGESPLQHYNSIFAQQYLAEFSDGVIYRGNDEALSLCRAQHARGQQAFGRLLRRQGKVDRSVDTSTLNRQFAGDIAAYTFPLVQRKSLRNQRSAAVRPWDAAILATTVCAPSHVKFASLYTSTSDAVSDWSTLANDFAREGSPSIAAHAVLRGEGGRHEAEAEAAAAAAGHKVAKAFGCDACGGNMGGRLEHDVSWAGIPKGSRSIAVCANRVAVANDMDRVLSRAREMHSAAAYLHVYQRHGVEGDDFIAAFESVQRVIDAYDEWADARWG